MSAVWHPILFRMILRLRLMNLNPAMLIQLQLQVLLWNLLANMVGIKLPINTQCHDVMFIRRPIEIDPNHPVVIDEVNTMYFRPETGRLTLVGLDDINTLGESPDGDTDHT